MKKTVYICDICKQETNTPLTKMSLPCDYSIDDVYCNDYIKDCDICPDCRIKIIDMFKEKVCHLVTDGVNITVKNKELN